MYIIKPKHILVTSCNRLSLHMNFTNQRKNIFEPFVVRSQPFVWFVACIKLDLEKKLTSALSVLRWLKNGLFFSSHLQIILQSFFNSYLKSPHHTTFRSNSEDIYHQIFFWSYHHYWCFGRSAKSVRSVLLPQDSENINLSSSCGHFHLSWTPSRVLAA